MGKWGWKKMGTSTERYHRKKRLRKRQEERQEDTMKKLEELNKKRKNDWVVQIDGSGFNADGIYVQLFDMILFFEDEIFAIILWLNVSFCPVLKSVFDLKMFRR